MRAKPRVWGFLVLVTAAHLSAPSTQSETPTVITPEAARDYVGREVVVDGTVVQVSVSRRSATTFLNFGAVYPNHIFTAVIFRGSRSLFPKAEQWAGRRLDRWEGPALQG